MTVCHPSAVLPPLALLSRERTEAAVPGLPPPQGCWKAELMQVTQARPEGWRGQCTPGGACPPPAQLLGQDCTLLLALTALCSACPRQGPDWAPSVQILFPAHMGLLRLNATISNPLLWEAVWY